MKEMNTLETQLRSWTPRRPSPKLERRLLGNNRPHYSIPRLLSVLAPTAACFLLTLSMLKQSAQELLPEGGAQAAIVAMGLSNQNFAAYLPSAFRPIANRLDTFEWTNGGNSKSSMGSLTPPMATDLQ